jgi:hypothetical protein
MSEFFGFIESKIFIAINTTLTEKKKIFSGIDSTFNHEKKLELRAFLEKIGETMLTNEGKKKEKIESCKLGYAKAESMVLFPYNIPTMTITAIWCDGKLENGTPWISLASRRRRTKNGNFIGED